LHLVATTVSAAVVYSPGVRGIAAGLLDWLLPLSVGSESLFAVTSVLLAGLVVLPALSYRYAVRRFDTYTLA
jgi:hypothetical protein